MSVEVPTVNEDKPISTEESVEPESLSTSLPPTSTTDVPEMEPVTPDAKEQQQEEEEVEKSIPMDETNASGNIDEETDPETPETTESTEPTTTDIPEKSFATPRAKPAKRNAKSDSKSDSEKSNIVEGQRKKTKVQTTTTTVEKAKEQTQPKKKISTKKKVGTPPKGANVVKKVKATTKSAASKSTSGDTKKGNKSKQIEKKERKPHRFRSGTVALRDIKKCQKQTTRKLPHAVLKRIIRYIMHDEGYPNMRFERKAVHAIHDLLETKVVDHFKVATDMACHRGIKSVREPDFRLASCYKRSY